METRIEQLTDDLYHHVFSILDSEIEFDGMEAGRVATIVSEQFKTEAEK